MAMELFLYASIFVACAVMLYISGEWLVHGLSHLSRTLGIREFVLAFFIMATAASLPNLFVGITSALEGIPELSLGDIFGNNIIAMTLAAAAGVFASKQGYISSHGETVKTSLLFTFGAAVLPILLILDGRLSRVDGLILIAFFVFYVYWLISRHERFSKKSEALPVKTHADFFAHARRGVGDIVKIIAGIALLIVAAFGIVSSASFFASYFGVSLLLVGLLVVGLGNALPEVYFSFVSARRGDTSLIMGNLMGSVIVPATFVLGVVALIHPFETDSLEFLAENRVFLLLAAAMFFVFATSHRKINRREALLLTLVYLAFVIWTVTMS
jgi:cation:H+ antiporter